MGMRGLPALKRAVPARFVPEGAVHSGWPAGRRHGQPSGADPECRLSLRSRALTHSSRAATRVQSNERLEFLGDSVLGLAIAAELFRALPARARRAISLASRRTW